MHDESKWEHEYILVILTYIFCLKWNTLIVTFCFDCLIIQLDGYIYKQFLFKRHSSNVCMPIEKLLCISDFVVLLIECFLIWISTEIALIHGIIHCLELFYFMLKKPQMHNKLYPHYTIYIIFLFCRDMSWILWFYVNCISVRTWYKIQSNASTRTADRSLQHLFLLSYRLTVTNRCFSRNSQFLIQSLLSFKKQPTSLGTCQILLWAPLQLRPCEITTLLTNPEIHFSPQR